jgi:hypothetical protein
MFDVTRSTLHRIHSGFLNLYIEQVGQACISPTPDGSAHGSTPQLFGHNGPKKIATREGIEPYSWVSATFDSYLLWLSYAKLGEPGDTRRLQPGDCSLTEHGHYAQAVFRRCSPK